MLYCKYSYKYFLYPEQHCRLQATLSFYKWWHSTEPLLSASSTHSHLVLNTFCRLHQIVRSSDWPGHDLYFLISLPHHLTNLRHMWLPLPYSYEFWHVIVLVVTLYQYHAQFNRNKSLNRNCLQSVAAALLGIAFWSRYLVIRSFVFDL